MSTALAVALCIFLFRRGLQASMLAYLAAFFAFFAFGPVINVLLGNDIFPGSVSQMIPKAALGFAVALATWAVVDLISPEKLDQQSAAARSRNPPRRYATLTASYWTLTLYGFGVAGFVIASGSLGKLGAINAAGPFHYQYLLAQICIGSMGLLAWRDRWTRRAFIINSSAYLTYCVATSERDFMFVAFALLLHASALGYVQRSRWLPIAAAGLTVAGTLLFTLRQAEEFGWSSLLNQGSLLFVDTYTLHVLPHLPPEERNTYANLLTGPPGDHRSVSEWFVHVYAPGSPSGYGFSLTAEARMNAGLLGIAALFLAIGLIHRRLLRRAAEADWALALSPLFTTTLMYAFRGDLRTFLLSLAYGVGLFLAIRLTSTGLSDHCSRSSGDSMTPETVATRLRHDEPGDGPEVAPVVTDLSWSSRRTPHRRHQRRHPEHPSLP